MRPLLVLAFIVGTVSACGGGSDEPSSSATHVPTASPSPTTSSPTPTPEPTSTPTAVPVTRVSAGGGIQFGDAQLTDNNCDSDPAVSRDGRLIAFVRSGAGCANQSGSLMIVSTDGSGLREVAPLGKSPSWSPDGSSLVFEVFSVSGANNSAECGLYSIVTVDINSGVQRMIGGAGSVHGASWSPDGRFLLLGTCVDGQVGPLSVFTPDGQLVRTSGTEVYQYWTSDGHILTDSCLVASPESDSLTAMPPGTLVLTQTQFPWERPAPSRCEP